MIKFLIGVTCLFMVGCQSAARHAAIPVASIHTATNVTLSNEEAVKESLYAQLNEWRSVRYDYGGLSKQGVDCSGFVYLTYLSQFGIELPRTTAQLSHVGRSIPQRNLRAGDLVFFRTGRKARHVGILVEGRRFIHASKSNGVMLSSLDDWYWSKKYWKAQRVESKELTATQDL